MNIKLFNIIFALMVSVAALAAPADSLVKANQLYAENDYHLAAVMYENIIAEGYESAALFYNLANAYFRTSEYTKAILFYERALLLAPNDEAIKFNLLLANQYVVDNIIPLPTPFFVQAYQNFANLLSETQWSVLSLALFALMLVAVLIYLLARTLALKKIGFAFAIVFLVFSGFSFLMARNQHNKLVNRNHAIIFTPTVTVKAAPDFSGTDLFVIHEGLKVKILQKIGNWLEIRLEDGNTGWVTSEVLEII